MFRKSAALRKHQQTLQNQYPSQPYAGDDEDNFQFKSDGSAGLSQARKEVQPPLGVSISKEAIEAYEENEA